MRMVGDSMRIGDSERDEAVSMLQEHHAEGRLSTEEFDERMGKALEARTGSDLPRTPLHLPAVHRRRTRKCIRATLCHWHGAMAGVLRMIGCLIGSGDFTDSGALIGSGILIDS